MDFITNKKEMVLKCPRCKKQSLFAIESTSVTLSYDDQGQLKDTVWFWLNKDIECTNCDYKDIISSDNAGSESITKLLTDKYKYTNSAKMINEAIKQDKT